MASPRIENNTNNKEMKEKGRHGHGGSDMRPRKVSLASICVDEEVQPRSNTSMDAIKRYALIYRASPKTLPPITLGQLDDGRLVLVDGFHRVHAARRARLTALPATIARMDEQTVRWAAVEANLRNGLPISRRDRREVFRRFVEAERYLDEDGQPMSSRALAVALPIASYKTMLHWMQVDFPQIHAVMVGREAEEEEGERILEVDPTEEFLAVIDLARRDFLGAIKKASKRIDRSALRADLASIQGEVERAAGIQLLTLDDVLKATRKPQMSAEEDF